MTAPVVEVQMLIRRPVADVFQAFIEPDITTRFWFTRSSGRIAEGATATWEWEMYGASTQVHVREVQQNRSIRLEWDEPLQPVEFTFSPRDDGTLVRIRNWGFAGDTDSVVAEAMDARGGFTVVLAGLKALLEHGVTLDLIADQYPDAHVDR